MSAQTVRNILFIEQFYLVQEKKNPDQVCGTEVSINIGFLATNSSVLDSSIFLLFLVFSSTVCNRSGVHSSLFVLSSNKTIKTFF